MKPILEIWTFLFISSVKVKSDIFYSKVVRKDFNNLSLAINIWIYEQMTAVPTLVLIPQLFGWIRCYFYSLRRRRLVLVMELDGRPFVSFEIVLWHLLPTLDSARPAGKNLLVDFSPLPTPVHRLSVVCLRPWTFLKRIRPPRWREGDVVFLLHLVSFPNRLLSWPSRCRHLRASATAPLPDSNSVEH